jgi:hypothetical protein
MNITDKDRLDWLDKGGRIARFTDGWNAWSGKGREVVADTVREAIDGAIRQESLKFFGDAPIVLP